MWYPLRPVLTAGSHLHRNLTESSAISTPHTAFWGHLMDYGVDGLGLFEGHWMVVSGFQGLWDHPALYGEQL